MSSSRFLFPLYLILSFALLLRLATSYETIYQCSGTNISANGLYSQNLNNLLTYLDSKTPLTGFGSGSLGLNQSQAYGLALCRGDLNTTECKACVDTAIKEIQTICQFTEAIIWYDYCQLRYSDLNFLGEIDEQIWFLFGEPTNVSNPVYFNEKVLELLVNLTNETYVSPKMYAEGTMGIGNSTTLYGMVQCTRDLSNTDCKSCLSEVINFIPQYLYGKQGGKGVGGSCNVRFEIFPFLISA
ncbi:cysteine-rich repeat secretory protein 38-like [Rhododendron vialii]|uniref:cysteine-rich repeat secretory protein 38-like n=1 Tax=Rhododendron vialii TaxID=182163 RepID=UPI00265FCA10|nr:cysteine-rich repeat secretory protein 38-like [Rhododendron vialii]